jgi:acyl-CoA reductase-like NAD-dependent aldehyde dehydrogenase
MIFDGDYTMTINGNGVAPATTFDVVNPATETVIAQAPNCSRFELDEAVAAARRAFPGWRATPIERRRKFLVDMADRIAANIDPLMRLLTREQGKPYAEATGEITNSAYWLRTASTLDLPVTVNDDTPERRSETRHVPLGVVAAIAPWNYPIILSMFKLAPALLAGNSVVLKPSPFTPLTTLKIGELMRDLLPPGVLNVISGGDALGPWMTGHPGVDKVSFTGSTATGRRVMASAAASLKRVTLELGGNDPAIVLPDVDVKAVAQELFWAAFQNSGQICVAAKRMYVHEDIYEPLKGALVDYAKTVKVGDGAERGTQLGPVQNAQQYARVNDLIEDAKVKGYKLLMGGECDRNPGYFVPITIIDNPPDNARVVMEEQFGPVLPLLRFGSIDEVVARANASEYGLAGSVWSSDPEKALAIGERLEAGTIWINEVQYMTPFSPFAGHKQSGFGVENGIEGLLEYTCPQTIVVKKKPQQSSLLKT